MPTPPPGARSAVAGLASLLTASLLTCGCTGVQQYIHNGFKVGPNFSPPPAPLAPHWIEAGDERVRQDSDDVSQWWKVFNDPVLDDLICNAYRQNLTLREAGFRILQARAQLAIARGELFPQSQTMTAGYSRNAFSIENANTQIPTPTGPVPLRQFFSQWDYGFNLSWELDFWGRIRRAIEANADDLSASVANYDDVLVTLLADVATDYVQLRTLQKQIEYARANADLQRETLNVAEARFKGGIGTVGELDVDQARSTLGQTEAEIPELEIQLQQTSDRLCVLLGMPPEALREKLAAEAIPAAPPDAIVGVPADLLRRRPDIRRAEAQAAAQSAQIGVAEADFYPRFAINGTFGYAAEEFADLFRSSAMDGQVGPSFEWKILNYGRLRNNVRLQDARFQELATAYQQSVLNAEQEVEDGLATFLHAQQRAKSQAESVAAADKAVGIVIAQYKAGTVDFTRVTQVQQGLVLQQNTLAEAQGEIALGLIQVYRALGGGWQIRCTGCDATAAPATSKPPLVVTLPPPPEIGHEDMGAASGR
ncbi:MAG TPA: efflux transporter outer membrane subunit [Gemmataceae bacterium]|nr:efflux transporter outer membrane subunit [Gemmataceae bacterium]